MSFSRSRLKAPLILNACTPVARGAHTHIHLYQMPLNYDEVGWARLVCADSRLSALLSSVAVLLRVPVQDYEAMELLVGGGEHYYKGPRSTGGRDSTGSRCP